MSEAVAFFCGLVTMAIVWFVNDTKNNPYMRGYADGLNVGIQEAMKGIDKIKEEMKRLDAVISDMRGESE
jgi:hypothetical protein